MADKNTIEWLVDLADKPKAVLAGGCGCRAKVLAALRDSHLVYFVVQKVFLGTVAFFLYIWQLLFNYGLTRFEFFFVNSYFFYFYV